jgi:uncharacterized Zn-binding protein involved in type VI secretion
MVTRYHIRLGDKTTVDGTVIDGSATEIAMGHCLAHEGDKVSCPKCHSMGQIVCDGPRWSFTGQDGRQAALSGDICLCKCNPAPRLVASQTSMSMHMDASPGIGTGAGQGATAQSTLPHDEQFLLRDKATGKTLGNVPYRVQTASGNVISGVTDGNSRTQRIRTDAAEQLVFHLLHGSQA